MWHTQTHEKNVIGTLKLSAAGALPRKAVIAKMQQLEKQALPKVQQNPCARQLVC
jgi:hypothetical protein